jgi:hypothetical protein
VPGSPKSSDHFDSVVEGVGAQLCQGFLHEREVSPSSRVLDLFAMCRAARSTVVPRGLGSSFVGQLTGALELCGGFSPVPRIEPLGLKEVSSL